MICCDKCRYKKEATQGRLERYSDSTNGDGQYGAV